MKEAIARPIDRAFGLLARLRDVYRRDPIRVYLFVGGVLWARFLTQGVPLWDDDFTSWFDKINGHGLLKYLWDWLCPLSTQPQFWGFNERPAQSVLYKLCQAISGYDSWSFFWFKSVVYGALGLMLYRWGLRLIAPTGDVSPIALGQRLAALAAALFFLVSPGPVAALVMHQDIAPLAELWLLVVTYCMLDELERTDQSLQPRWGDPHFRRWFVRWSTLTFFIYLGYKVKADLKLIPFILAAWVLILRRRQWKLFAFPLALMMLLAIPWGPGVFRRLPPFVPGSGGSQIGWMWQPASARHLLDFIIAPNPFDVRSRLDAPGLSLQEVLGPFLLIALAAFFLWSSIQRQRVSLRFDSAPRRATLFALLWLLAIMGGVSALPTLNSAFRVRYGILTLVPTSLLLARVFGCFVRSLSRPERSLPRWAIPLAVTLFMFQWSMNLNRSIHVRRDLGSTMIAVDGVYDYVRQNLPHCTLTFMPDFLSYRYRPRAAPAFAHPISLKSPQRLRDLHGSNIYAISWSGSLWEQLELIRCFPGCGDSLFDRIYPCNGASAACLMHYIGPQPLFDEATFLRGQGRFEEARRTDEAFLSAHPGDQAGQFFLAVDLLNLKEWTRSEAILRNLEESFPTHAGILYNHAMSLQEMGRLEPAIERFQAVLAQDSKNYAAGLRLFTCLSAAGPRFAQRARDQLEFLRRTFPEDAEVKRLCARSQRHPPP